MDHAADFGAGCALVFAHPDDEILWAGSLVRSATRVILAFDDVPFGAERGAARRQAMATYPGAQVECLGLTEANVLDAAGWPRPRNSREGYVLHAWRAPMRGFSATRYRENFDRIIAALEPRLQGIRRVVTHNPWGEYGHEEHVQVFRAVEALAERMGFEVWVSPYFSARTRETFTGSLHRLGSPSAPFPLDPAYLAEVRAHYERHRCWTWYPGEGWPAQEHFFPLLPADAPPVAPGKTLGLLYREQNWPRFPLRRRLRVVLERVLRQEPDETSRV